MSHATDYILRRFHLSAPQTRVSVSPTPPPAPGQILLITGMSGAGKSTLLRSIVQQIPQTHRIDLVHLRLPRLPVVDCIPLPSIEKRLNLLSRVGLAEVYLWLRPPAQLSEGQRFRLRIAIAMARAQKRPATLICDEFASTLDTLTALMISQTLRKSIRTNSGLSCILATGRDELLPALKPDHHHHCDFQFNQTY